MALKKDNQLDYISYLYAISVLLGGIFGFLKAGIKMDILLFIIK